MKNEKKSDYDLNMNDYSQMYDFNFITLRLITQLCLYMCEHVLCKNRNWKGKLHVEELLTLQ